MNEADMAGLEPLLALLAAHPGVQCRLMRQCEPVAQAGMRQQAAA
jgi:hypothetical protein